MQFWVCRKRCREIFRYTHCPSQCCGAELRAQVSATKSALDRQGATFGSQTQPARWLANYLHRYVAVREDVAITVREWERLWTEDFRKLLSGYTGASYSLDEIELMIRASQCGKTVTYCARGLSL